MKIILTDTYKKKAKKFLIKHPELKTKYIETLCTLQDSYDNPKLKLHKLKGELKQFWSISINYEYRIILLLKIENDKIYLIDIGSHDEVY